MMKKKRTTQRKRKPRGDRLPPVTEPQKLMTPKQIANMLKHTKFKAQ